MTYIDPSLIDVVFPEHDGYPAEIAAEDDKDTIVDACRGWEEDGGAAREFPPHLWIEPRDWPAVAAENDKWKTWPIDYLGRFTNQSPTHECTTHSLVKVAEACRNRQRAIAVGPPLPNEMKPISTTSDEVWLSCLSIYAEANPNIRGGASTRGVLEIAVRRGFIPDRKQPREYGFKHQLTGTQGKGNACQSNGSWVKLRDFPDGWEQTAKHFKPLEVIIPESWEQVVCLVLHGYMVGVGRSGHAIPYGKWIVSEKVMQYPDSYDVFRYDSVGMIKSAVGSAYTIASMTTPDDWSKPAG